MRFSREQLIARLWKSSEDLVESKNGESAKVSILKSPSSCIGYDDCLICYLVKLQRLIIGILRRRLSGINVDNIFLKTVPYENCGALLI